ncbi:exosortase/archaeosortase family protein [Bryocella elongata]|nr:exosortase/archaeosortase family protein [Bryocella elongata]
MKQPLLKVCPPLPNPARYAAVDVSMLNAPSTVSQSPSGSMKLAFPGGESADSPNLGRQPLLPILVLAAPILFLYWRISFKLVSDWYNFGDDSHGFLIPFFVLFLLATERQRYLRVPTSSDWSGIPLVVLALLTLMVGVFGADLFLQRLSFVLLVAGLVWSLLGRRMLVALRFPIGVMLLGIPLPTLVLNHITFPLQLLASRVASGMLPLAGVPVLREGNVINLPAMQLEVAEACSGIRSLMSLLTVAIIFGYFVERTNMRRVLLALASIPIAVAANSIRIFGTGLCVQYWDPDKAMGFFHEFSGWLIFLVSLSLLYAVHLVMGRFDRAGKAA